MPLSASDIHAVKSSWGFLRKVNPLILGDVFYSRLFLQHPSLKKLFHQPMTSQYEKLVDMLTTLISRLERLEELDENIKQLALRHKGYGVKPEQYKMVGEALLWTMEQALGLDWTLAVADAWRACYMHLSNTLLKALDEKPVQAR